MQAVAETVRKEEVEKLLGYTITDGLFQEALRLASGKQAYIFEQYGSPVALQHWYLVKLTEEYVRSLALSKYTMDLCSELSDMEKEHPTKSQGAPTSNHIITVSAL